MSDSDILDDLDLDYPEELEQTIMKPDEDMMEAVQEEQDLLAPKPEAQPQVDPVMDGFENLKGKPSDKQIEDWKGQHGKVFTVGLDTDEYYVFRSLRRQEWRNLMKVLAKYEDEMKKKEHVVARAVLWPDLKVSGAMARLSAGTPDTIYELVLQASNFLMPQEALTLVRKL